MAYFEAVLFDFDGVIVDSTPIHLSGWAEAYRHYFGDEAPTIILESLVGKSTSENGTILAECGGRPDLQEELTKRKANYVLNHLHEIPLIDGVRGFLLTLAKHGIPYGIASNAPRAFIEAALVKYSLPAFFYLGLEDYAEPKPNPEAYLKGAKQLHWSRPTNERIAVFEDSTHGINAAVAAGMTAIGVCSQHPSEILLNSGAKHAIRSFLAKDFLDEYFLRP